MNNTNHSLFNLINSFKSLYKNTTLYLLLTLLLPLCAHTQTIELKQYWNFIRKDNHLDLKQNEKALQKVGYITMRTEGFIYQNNDASNKQPLFLYYSVANQDNFSSTDKNPPKGYRKNRIQGYVYASEQEGTLPLKIYYSKARKDYMTLAQSGSENAAKSAGYRYVKTVGYIAKSIGMFVGVFGKVLTPIDPVMIPDNDENKVVDMNPPLTNPTSGLIVDKIIKQKITIYKSPKFKIGHQLQEGSTVYLDRNFLYSEIPTKLKGLDYLITSNADKFSSGDNLFTINHPDAITVYIAIDHRITPPSWLLKNAYTNTYEKLKIWIPDNNTFLAFHIYQKKYKKGEELVFGGNQNTKGQKQCGMYLVFVNTNNMRPKIKLFSTEPNGKKLSGYATIKVSKSKGGEFINDQLVSKTNVGEDIKSNKVCVTQKRQLKAANNSFFLLNDQRASMLFPGNILNISQIEAGNYTSAITPQRKSYRISTDIFGLTNSATATVKDAKLADFRNAKTLLLNKTNFNANIGAKAKLGKFKSTQSEVDFNIKVTGGVNSLVHSGGFSFAYHKTNKKNRFVVEIEKLYYDIDFTSEGGFFKNPNILKNSDWLYVSNVKYGTKLILNIESNYTQKEVEIAMRYRYNGGLISGGGKVAVKHKKVLQDMSIEVISLGEQPEKYLSNLIKDPTGKTFAEAFAYGKIDANTQLYPLAYTLRYVEDDAVATIETYANYNQQICGRLKNILRIEVKDVFVARSDDGSGGEELFGWLKIKASGYGETTVFDRGENSHWPETEGGSSPLSINGKTIFYLQYRDQDINNPDLFIELYGHLKEDDSGSDDDFGHTSHKYTIKNIVAGATIEKFLEEDVLSQAGTSNQTYPCDDGCKAMLFTDDNSRVIIRYTIDMVDQLPPNAKIGLK